jgi:hypothetical protein
MIPFYRVLSQRITDELDAISRVVTRAERSLQLARETPRDQDLWLDAVALNLHDFYTGAERICSQIAGELDKSVPSGREWHRELLRQMTLTLKDIRPPVLSADTMRQLDEYLRLRHVVRNIYTFQFDPAQIEGLVQQVRPAFEHLQSDLQHFQVFLEQASHADEGH